MIKRLLQPHALWQEQGLTVLRLVFGLLLVYHGWEIFNIETMKGYTSWDQFKDSSNPLLKVYVGKTSEFITGLLLTLGLFTRITCLWIIATMAYITFFVGNGKFWYEDQHPFMFILMASVFFFTGPGQYSLDNKLFNKNYSN
jgi:uncharacterized membrane protein YphA (DoxX/SURF4 family)